MNKPQQPVEPEMEQFRRVLTSDTYTLLADTECRAILTRLSDGQISVGKCIEAIAEISLGIKPRLAPDAAQESPEALALLPCIPTEADREAAHHYNMRAVREGESDEIKTSNEVCRERQLMDALRRATEAKGRVAELQTLLDAKNAALAESDKERNKWYDIAQEAINGK